MTKITFTSKNPAPVKFGELKSGDYFSIFKGKALCIKTEDGKGIMLATMPDEGFNPVGNDGGFEKDSPVQPVTKINIDFEF